MPPAMKWHHLMAYFSALFLIVWSFIITHFKKLHLYSIHMHPVFKGSVLQNVASDIKHFVYIVKTGGDKLQ